MFKELLNALYNFEEDIFIEARGEDAFLVKKYHTVQGWRLYDRALTEEEINLLLADHYTQIASGSSKSRLFHPQWCYRVVTPNWSLFQQWLLVWYEYKEIEVRSGTEKHDFYVSILEALNCYSTQEKFEEWARDSWKYDGDCYMEVISLLVDYKTYIEEKKFKPSTV